MAVRVDYTEVQAILTTTVDAAVITALIADASAWVDAHLVGTGLADAVLTAVEKYLAAHLCVLTEEGGEGQIVEAARSDIREKYAARNDEHGDTSYIRTAAAFDRTGHVAQHWLGKKRVQWMVGDGYNFDGASG